MIQQSEDQRSAFIYRRWFRQAVTLIGGVVAAIVAPLIVSNRAFQVIAAFSVAVVVWDCRLIAKFYFTMFRQFSVRLRARIGQPWLINIPGLLFCATILSLLASIIISPIQLAFLHYNIVPVLAGSAVALLVLPSVYSAAMKAAAWIDSKHKLVHLSLMSVLLMVFFSIQITIALSLYSFPGWDAGAVLSNAFGLADGSLHTINADYFSKYPNNIFLTLMLTAFSRLMLLLGVTDLLLASVVLNVAVLLSGILLTYLVARRLAGTGAAMLTLLPSIVFVVISPWIAVPYSDTFALPFPVLLIYLYLRAKDASRFEIKMCFWAVLGFAAVVGYSIKPTVVFVLVAIVGVDLTLTVYRHKARRQVLFALVSALVVAGVFWTTSAALTHFERSATAIPFDVKNNPREVPFTHFLKMGAQGYGLFNEQDVRDTVGITDPRERLMNGLHVYVQRVEAMGPLGYADFLWSKARWTFGDGTFFMWSEGLVGSQDDPFLSKNATSRNIQDYLWVKGGNFPFMTGVWQSSWFVLLFLVALPIVLRGGRMFSGPASIMRISLLALFLFLLFFETRSRYLYLYMPFFILLSTLTLDSVMSRMRSGPPVVWRPAAHRSVPEASTARPS
ncbi:hypothetical protein [Arthrobacter sp.]|uniref:hypothetical protein n=1 Tax=Arthrobacter sp. TaxID=1667 RepID=UPI003396C882